MDQHAKFQKDTRQPNVVLPSMSCDCQVHVYGDPGKYPPRPGSPYAQQSDANIDAALHMHRALGIERGVIVQSTVHGTNHGILFDALAVAGPNYRGVAVIDDSVTDKELLRLHEAGVRGARFNFWKKLNIAPTPEGFLRSIDRIKQFGWHAKVHSAFDEWIELKDLLVKAKGIPIVIDHMGHPDLKKGLDTPAMRVLLDLLRDEHWWVLLSNADRASAEQQEWSDVLPLARKLIDVAPDRTIWCTDWPHVQYDKPVVPNDAELLEFLSRAAPDPAQLRRILVDNPARLFGF